VLVEQIDHDLSRAPGTADRSECALGDSNVDDGQWFDSTQR
jgi:hypothetical protein